MKKIVNKILLSICLFCITIALSNQVKAESFSSNKSSVTVGESFTITISGINGKVTISSNDKVSLSNKGTVWVTGSMTITGTAKSVGTGTVTVKFNDATTTGANPKDLSGQSRSVNVTVKEKEQEKPKTETPTQTTTKKPTNTQTSNKTNTTTKNNNTKKNEQNKTKTEIVATEEKEEATPLWGINEVKLIGVKENGEKVDLQLDKTFNITTYDYLCNVSSDIKRIEVQKEAYEYNDFVKITGIEEDLKDGENIITLKLAKEGQKELIYTIKVNKEAKPQEIQTSTEVIEEEKEEKTDTYVCIKLWKFILLEIVIVAIAVIITFLITKKVICDKANN